MPSPTDYDPAKVQALCTGLFEALRPLEIINNFSFTPAEIAIAYLMAGEYHVKCGKLFMDITKDDQESYRKTARIFALALYNKTFPDDDDNEIPFTGDGRDKAIW